MEEAIQYLETDEYGTFTNNSQTGQTAEEVYQEWLANKDNPPVKEPNKIDICLQQLVEAQTLLVDLQMELLMNGL